MILRIFVFALGAFGLYLVWGGVVGVRASYALQQRGVLAKGVVVDSTASGARSVTYYPIVEFTAVDGKSHRFQAWSGSTEKGTPVDVIYLADDPSVAARAGSEQSMSGSVAGAVLGLFILAVLWVFFGPTGASVAASSPGMNPIQANAEAILSRFVPMAKWFAILVIGGTGLAFFISGAIWGVKRAALWNKGVRTEGTVIGAVDRGSTKGSFPLVEFTASDGTKHQFGASSSGSYPVGTRAEVIYDPGDASIAQLSSFGQLWLGPLVATLFGAFFLFFAMLAYRFLIAAAP